MDQQTGRRPEPGPSPIARYAVAAGAVVVAWAVRTALVPWWDPTFLPFALFYPVVVLAAWYGRVGPAILAIVLSILAADWFFRPPLHSLLVEPGLPRQAGVLLAFTAACISLTIGMELLHRVNDRLEDEIKRRHRVETSFANEREVLATTLASIGDAVIVTDPSGQITFLNAEAERLTGFRLAEAVAQPLPAVFRIVTDGSRQPADNPVDTVMRLGTIQGLANHTILIAKDGRETAIDDSAAPIRTGTGPLLGVVLVFRDVTAQRQAQQTRAHLAAVVQFSGDAIITKNLDGMILSWNAGAQRIFGYRPEEIIGQPVTVLFPAARLNEEDDILNRLRQGQPSERLETVRVAKGGRHIPVLVSVSPIRDDEGRVVAASKIIHDVTDLVAAREALVAAARAREAELATIIDQTPFMLTRCTRDLRYRFVSRAYAAMLGRRAEDVAGKPIVEIMGEEGFATIRSHVETALAGRVVEYQSLIPFEGVGTKALRVIYTPDRDAAGRVIGWIASIVDITEQMRAEEALRQSEALLRQLNEQLEQRVEERTAQLQATISDLEALSYTIAHDMRAPLRAMQAFSTILADDYATALDDTAKGYLGRIAASARRLDRLIQDVLDYSRLARTDIGLEPVNAQQLFDEIIASYPNLQENGARITSDGALPTVWANTAALTQVFANLLGNAVKFVEPGVPPDVHVRAEHRGDRVRFWFEDNGVGIESSEMERIFQVFQTAHPAGRYDGTGVGLAIVRKAVEQMGGRVGVESEPGAGSRFWVDLPARASPV